MNIQNLGYGLIWLGFVNIILGGITIGQSTGEKELLSHYKYISFAFFLWSTLIDMILLFVISNCTLFDGVLTLVRNGVRLSTVTSGLAFLFWILFLVNKWSPGIFGCFVVASLGVAGLLLCSGTYIVMHTTMKPEPEF